MTADGPLAGTGDTVTYTYDASGFVATITDEVALLTQVIAKNASGQPLTIVDPNNVTTTMTYDERNRLKTITVNPGASQLVTSFDYYLDGDIKRITRPDSSYFDYTYDDARRLTLITNNSGEKIELGYDLMGNVTSRTVKDSASTITYSHTQMFDELGRLLKSIGANAQTMIFSYDKVDSLKTITDPRSHLYSFGYDALNRLISETDQGNAQVNYGLDGRNGLQTYTDPRNLVTSYVRNGFGEAIQEASPDAGTTVFYRDARGLVTQSSDARGVVTNFTYDNAGRMLTRKPAGALSENIVYTWDQIGGGNKGKGRLTKIVDESGTTSWKYNALGQIITDTRVVGANTYATSYTYTGGNLATITYPSGRIVSFTRNALGQISSVTTKLNSSSPSQDVATSIAYKPMSDLVSGFTYGNGLTYAATFTNDYWQKTLKVKDGATSIVNLTYGYSDKINLTAITDNLTAANSLSLGYSVANRLASATGPWGTLSWTYDGVGNRLTETLGATVDTTNYPSTSNKPTNITRSGSTIKSWTYDGAGNVQTDAQSVDSYVYIYNKANRISSVTDLGSPWATYKYNGLDQLASRTVTAPVGPPGTIQYIYDLDGHLIAEADSATAATLREYVWLDDLPVAVVANVNTSPILLMVHADHLKRPIRMTDSTKTTVWQAIWKPFGEPYSLSGTQSLDARLPGQWFQIETGLAYNWHRHYDPTTGRYTQADPLGFPDGLSRYAYARSSPLMKGDLSGLAINSSNPSHSPVAPGANADNTQLCSVLRKCFLQAEVPAPDGGYLCAHQCSDGSSMTVRTRSRRCPKVIDDTGFIPDLP